MNLTKLKSNLNQEQYYAKNYNKPNYEPKANQERNQAMKPRTKTAKGQTNIGCIANQDTNYK
jgi:hypothetical protein